MKHTVIHTTMNIQENNVTNGPGGSSKEKEEIGYLEMNITGTEIVDENGVLSVTSMTSNRFHRSDSQTVVNQNERIDVIDYEITNTVVVDSSTKESRQKAWNQAQAKRQVLVDKIVEKSVDDAVSAMKDEVEELASQFEELSMDMKENPGNYTVKSF